MQRVPHEELADLIGTETGVSAWFTIGQDRIDAFADVTEDRQWIHVDTARAAEGPFGSTVAHGFLTLSLLSHLSETTLAVPDGAAMYLNYGLNKVRFLAPVPAGAQVRARNVLADVTERAPGQALITNQVTVEIEGEDTPAMVAETLVLAVAATPN